MDLVIRADATKEIGTGHVMRTIAIAQQWKRLGYGNVVLIGYVDSEKLKKLIEGYGIKLINPANRESLIELSQISRANKNRKSWCVVDGYHFSGNYIKSIKGLGFKIILVDDHGNRDSYPVDAVINGNFYAETLNYPQKNQISYLLGPRFALIRQEFLDCGKKEALPLQKATKLLITMGGSDPAGLTPKILCALSLIKDISFEIKVILGPATSKKLTSSFLSKGIGHHITLIHGSNNMPSLMLWADIAITAAGSTCLELAFVGVPFLVTNIADNQNMLAEWLLSNDMASELLGIKNGNLANTATSIKNLAIDVKKQCSYIKRLSRLVDGRGAIRVVKFMADSDF